MPEATEAAAPVAAPEAAAPQVSEYEAMIQAADAAVAAEAAEAPVTPAPAAPASTPEAPAAEEETGSKISAVLRAREKAQEIRDKAADDAASVASMKAEIAAMKEETARELAAAKAQNARISALAKEPLKAIKELGWDTKQLVDEVAREGSAEWQALKRQEAKLEALAAENGELKAWRESQAAREAKYDQERAAYSKRETEKQFLGLIPEGSAARTLYDESEILAKAHSAADEYFQKSNGKVASLEDLRDYLEEQASKRLAGIREQQPGTSAAQQAAKKASATQPKANGPRALSAASASERRTSPKPRADWDESDLYAEMKAAADAAMKA